MKKIIFAIVALVATLSLSSCKDEVEYVSPGTPSNPEQTTAGVYAGTWTRTNTSDNTVVEGQGTLTLVAGESAYITNVTAVCAAIDMDYTSTANITPAMAFYSSMSTNGFGTPFNGKADGKVASISFQKTVREGRKTSTFKYEFSGAKQ